MKYFLDTEFIEGTQKRPLILKGRLGNLMIGYPKPTIDLISIGIVSEDNREYYAISKDFNLNEAWNRWQQRTGEGDRNNIEPREYWIRENVLRPIWDEWIQEKNIWDDWSFTYKNFKKHLKKYGKTNKQIADEIKEFVGYPNYYPQTEYMRTKVELTKPEFYAYYADYDWVAFCWLFGRMIDLPNGFPMYCIDLKQEMNMIIKKYWKDVEMSTWGHTGIGDIKRLPNYPKQTNEHNALADARWNKELYEFFK
jgi:hypothetical protein